MANTNRMMHVVLALAVLSACQSNAVAPSLTTHVVTVVPAGGATGVDPTAPIVATFSHAMQAGMEQYVALHQGDVAGPVVPGAWMWSDDRTTLTFTPLQPLAPHATYTLHLGGGMRASDGGFVDFEHCVAQHGGAWATGSMMTGGRMNDMMGAGWRHPNGSFGMTFTFTTA